MRMLKCYLRGNRESEKFPMAEERLGKYSLERLVATGGMAEIWLARSPSDSLVAIKRILPHLARDERFISMFLDEASLASKLLHPNIVRIFELGQDGDEHFLAMEFIEGADLADVLDAAETSRTLIPIAAASFITCEVLDALHFAHTFSDGGKPLNIVHRDVSPHNVLLSEDGRVKLVDFGVAKAVERQSKTQTGVVKGKLSYMAPEQVRQEEVDARADIFAAGILFYELLTNQAPFGRDLTAISKILHDPPTDPRELRPTIPDALAEIVLKSLEKDPNERYQTSAEMRNVLRVWLGEQKEVKPLDIAKLTQEFGVNRRQKLDEELQTTTVGSQSPEPPPPPPAPAPAPAMLVPSRTESPTSSQSVNIEPTKVAKPLILAMIVFAALAGTLFYATSDTPSDVQAAPTQAGMTFYDHEVEEWEVSEEEVDSVAYAELSYTAADFLVFPWLEKLNTEPARLDPGQPDILDHLIIEAQAEEPVRIAPKKKKKKRVKRVRKRPAPAAEKTVSSAPKKEEKRGKKPTTLERIDKVIPSF